jgi:hypothetical protein
VVEVSLRVQFTCLELGWSVLLKRLLDVRYLIYRGHILGPAEGNILWRIFDGK